MTAVLAPTPIFKAWNNDGTPLAYGLLTTYAAGTDNKQAAYVDSTQTTPLTNPVELNFRGETPLWLNPLLTYKFVLTDQFGNQIPGYPVDNIPGSTTLQNGNLIPAITNTYTLGNSSFTWANLYLGPNGMAVLNSQGGIGVFTYLAAAEAAASVTPSNQYYMSGPSRYGAIGNGVANDQPAWESMGKVNGFHFIYDGTYLCNSKVQTAAFVSIEGSTRQNTLIDAGSGFADYLLEIGNQPSGPNPNVGLLRRLRFAATSTNVACLHMNQLSHMWRLDELLFQSSACPALVVDNCWDSNYTNIDVLSCGYVNQPANVGAAVKFINGSNNDYCRGLRTEQCPSGTLYVDAASGPIFIEEGKSDQGFIAQYAATITCYGQLSISDYTITGSLINGAVAFTGYDINLQATASLVLDNVNITGGTGAAAHILDQRTWTLVNGISDPTFSGPSWGPQIGKLFVSNCAFGYAHPSQTVNVTPAAIFSKIPLIWIERTGAVTGSSSAGPASTNVVTNFSSTINNQFVNGYLVHNPTGTHCSVGDAGSRRRITASFPGGAMVVAGNWALTIDADWSIEYQGGHFTPKLVCDENVLDQSMSLFSILQAGATISGTPTYQASSTGAQGGATSFVITAASFPVNTDATGYYLVDEITGEPFFITYGVDGSGNIAVAYDRTASINTAHTYSVVAGYFADAKIVGDTVDWSFAGKRKTALMSALLAAGFDQFNVPIWGFGTTGEPVNVGYSAAVTLDASQSHDFIITATNATAFTINAPVNLLNGDRVLITIKNTSGGSLGTITWNAIFKMPAYSAPSNGNGSSVEFFFDGTNLRQINTPVLVPN